MKEWETDKAWSDRFLIEIKRILGEHLISEASLEEDAKHNTDLLVLKADGFRIGCRIRRYKYYIAEFAGNKCKDEFTIRSGRPRGTKTELAKIIEGWGDFFFYGFSNEAETALEDWFLGDLKSFRSWFVRKLCTDNGTIPGFEQANKDKSSVFRVFKKAEMPSCFFKAECSGLLDSYRDREG